MQTAGISIGQIEKRELDPKEPRGRRSPSAFSPDITLYENAVVAKKSASLLGEYYLEIDPGSPFKRRSTASPKAMRKLKDGDEIKNVIEPVGIGEIMANVGTLMPVLRDILQRRAPADVRADQRHRQPTSTS